MTLEFHQGLNGFTPLLPLGKTFPFSWGVDTVNKSGCYLGNSGLNDQGSKKDGGFHTVKVDSYFPTELGLYNMSGNVSEMVVEGYDKNGMPNQTGTAGGGWLDDILDLKINKVSKFDQFKTGHPNVGFRLVQTYFPVR